VTVEWEYPAGAVDGCRIELWEETSDLWKHRLLRCDHDVPLTVFTVPAELLRPSRRYAVVVFARGRGAYSAHALAPFLYRPDADDPLLGHDPIRPEGLWPDEGVSLPADAGVELTWNIRDAGLSQAVAHVVLIEDGCLADTRQPVFETELAGPAATACRCVVPAGTLRPGRGYAWYVTARAADGRVAFAPSEGLFTTTEGG
jgi:hypothetical protein